MENPVLTVRDMYDAQQRNYDWESFKYVVPKKYPHKSVSNLRSGSMFSTKTNYLNDLQKQKKKIPGPNFYKFSTNSLRPTSGKMDKGERNTMSEAIRQKCQKENMPGPGAYFKRPKSAMTTMSTGRSFSNKESVEKKHYLNEVEYLAAALPGVGTYNISIPTHIPGPKLQKKAYRQSEKKEYSKEKQTNQKLLNTTQSMNGTFEWMRLQSKKKNSNFFGRSHRFVTESKFEKKPAPNMYKLNNEWSSASNIATLTATISNQNLKTVYYH